MKANYQANQGLVMWSKEVKTHIKSSLIGTKPCRTHLEAQGRTHTEAGLIRAQLGCDRTSTEAPWAHLSCGVNNRLCNVGSAGLGQVQRI
jgi:hypothetical protein